MNRLLNEKSSYLKHSAYQRIDWYPWSEEAFEKARREDKPVFLSSGAIWCHWCHVMAKECFENDEIVKILNEDFVCIKIDRDERPDIDRRYQFVVQTMGMDGGWPLSVFLTPEKRPFFGGTYFPAEDNLGRPGFKKVLTMVKLYYKNHKDEIQQYTEKLLSIFRKEILKPQKISEDLLLKGVDSILSSFDPQNGGFGGSPKFPMPGAIEFLIGRYYFTKNKTIEHVLRTTLNSMSKGGIHDQIGGGFHRYATDEAWIIPHFEKMADDNAWLLRNYLDSYAVLGDIYYKKVAEGIIGFLETVLSDKEGGFYASQDADVTPDDEGGYFTWTSDDLKSILSKEEFDIVSMHFLGNRGFMHHNPEKKVLFVALDVKDIAQKLGRRIEDIESIISVSKKKMLSFRNKRESPFVDKNIYTSLNGMLISAYLKAYRILKYNKLKDFALKSLHKVLILRFYDDELFHSDNVRAILDDYIFLIDALLYAYEVTGDSDYLRRSERLMEICIERLWDKDEGGFFDSPEPVLNIRLKGIEDIPHPSANTFAITVLLRLFQLTEKQLYLKFAETMLQAFASQAINLGINGAYYFASLENYYRMLRLTIYGEGDLIPSALGFYRPYTTIKYDKPKFMDISGPKNYIVPCLRSECYEAIYSEEELSDFLRKS
jgi:uncharacterized protein YyaL (SSP411 family)